jgi:hypothetical protein
MTKERSREEGEQGVQEGGTVSDRRDKKDRERRDRRVKKKMKECL